MCKVVKRIIVVATGKVQEIELPIPESTVALPSKRDSSIGSNGGGGGRRRRRRRRRGGGGGGSSALICPSFSKTMKTFRAQPKQGFCVHCSSCLPRNISICLCDIIWILQITETDIFRNVKQGSYKRNV
jgi:hypothetical protein